MEKINIANHIASDNLHFTSTTINLAEERNDTNLSIIKHEKEVEKLIDSSSKLEDVEFEKNKLNGIINGSSGDNFLSSTAVEHYLSEEDEFELQKIKQEALYINYSSNFKSENSLDLDFDCSELNASTSFELNTNPFEHSDVFIHEEVFSENFQEIEQNPNGGVPLNVDLCKQNTHDNLEDINYCSVLRDHNYIGQEMNSVRSEMCIKNLNDLRNYSNILSKFIADYEKSSELKTTETEVLIEEISENLNLFKDSMKNLNKTNKNINTESKEFGDKLILNDTTCNQEIIKPYSEVEIESLNLSENCSEPLEYHNNLLEADKSKNNFFEGETSILEKDKDLHILNQISRLGVYLVESCKKFSTSPNKNVKDFVNEKILECRKLLFLNTNTVSVQTDYSGKIFSEKRLKKINDKEKYRLLKDSSSSHITFSDNENVSNSFSSSESDLQINTDNESNSSYNGIDLSQYIEKPGLENKSKELNSLESGDSEQYNNYMDFNSGIQNSVSNANNFENISEGKDEIQEREINRLLDFKSLASKKGTSIQYMHNDVEKLTISAKSKSEKLLQMLEYSKMDDFSDGSNTDMEDNLATEKEFLVRRNEDLKQSLLDTSSSDSDTCSERITLENENNDSNTSLVLKFLETYDIENENNDENNEVYNPIVYQNISNPDKDADSEINNNQNHGESTFEDLPEIEKNSIFDKSFVKKPTKEKSFESLLTENERRRKYLKYNEELISLSSEESELEGNKTDSEQHSRILRPMMRQDQLASETKVAQKEENNRILRLKNKENIFKKAYKEHQIDRSNMKELILDYDLKSKKFIKVHPELFKHLKQHQIEGIKFMYDACYGSVNFINEHPGSGCILAHCMGLGKTLQLITLLHTVICNKELKTSRILVLCPKSTVMNWADEMQRWLAPLNTKNIKIYTFSDTSDVKNKLSILKEWASSGQPGFRDSGCLLIGYEAFRTLVSYHTYRKRSSYLTQSDLEAIQKTVKETLLQPGADLVVCDEGHIIKNRKAAISQAVTEITTPRRIILTGTPIQNNLKEYYSMVNFIKPSFLGTEKEFANLYANPIRYGQHKDSNKRDIKIMKQRSFVLHKKLSSFVQRREAALLKTFLPHKFEYVLFIPLSKVQSQLYEIFLESVSKRDDSKGRSLLTDYTCLRKIWTHPKVLENAWLNATMLKQKKEKRNTNLMIQSEDDEPDDIYDSQTGLMSVTSDWWRSHLTKQDLESIVPSNKLQAMFEILKMCEENREKCLIFSAFVAVLNVVEYFMKLINNNDFSTPNEGLGIGKFKGPWINGEDYYRLDGKTPKTLRHEMVKSFNNPNNIRARVFLISAKAGGQGINLIGANRVLILDTSWNPSNDQQNIFRIFRLGQTRNCYIYRLISLGTMEEKVYSRSVTKQAMSFRVVDEHQIDRHYSMAELAELYTLTYYGERPVPFLPQDSILANLLRNHSNLVYKYHEHDSLLENKIEQELSEQEKEDAWLAYERDTNYNAAITGGILPQFGRFDVFGNQTFIPPSEYTTSNNLADIAFNQRGITQHPTQPPFLSSYRFPSNDYYIDSLYKMSQNPQSYSSSMLGMDAINTQCAPNNNPRVVSSTSLISNTPNTLNYCNSLSPFVNTSQNISAEINSLNQSHYGTSTYSPSILNHFGHSSLMENLKKTLENYSNKNSTGSGVRVQKVATTGIQNKNPFQPSFLTNDSSVLPNNTTTVDAIPPIPTSVIMKNDLLLKQFNDQIKSATGSKNRYNLINKSNMLRPVMKTGKADSINCLATDNNISLIKSKKNKNNEIKTLHTMGKQNHTTLIRPEESGNSYKPITAANSTYITGLKPNMTEPKDNKKEENSVLAKSSGILLIENQTNPLLNNCNEETAAVENISRLNNLTANKTGAATKSINSLPVNFLSKSHISPTPKNLEVESCINNTQNTTNCNSPSRNLHEPNLRILNFPKSSQPNQINNSEKTNNILNFTSSVNQNIVITKVQDIKRTIPHTKKNAEAMSTNKSSIRSTTISNLIRENDKSIANKFLNSDLSITPARNKISNAVIVNQTQQIPEIENVTSQPTQHNQKKRTSASLQLSTNITNETDLHKRQKLSGVPKTELCNNIQNNYKL